MRFRGRSRDILLSTEFISAHEPIQPPLPRTDVRSLRAQRLERHFRSSSHLLRMFKCALEPNQPPLPRTLTFVPCEHRGWSVTSVPHPIYCACSNALMSPTSLLYHAHWRVRSLRAQRLEHHFSSSSHQLRMLTMPATVSSWIQSRNATHSIATFDNLRPSRRVFT
jgi:hypothetical protein